VDARSTAQVRQFFLGPGGPIWKNRWPPAVSQLVAVSQQLTVLGVPVAQLERDAALREVERLYRAPSPAMVAYANAHTLNLAWRSRQLRDALAGAQLVLNDGIGLAIAARLQRSRFTENLNGTDFTPHVLARAAAHGWPVYLLGSRPGVAEQAARKFADRFPGLELVGCHHGFFEDAESPQIVQRIRASGAGVLLVAMGNPRQEQWLSRYLPETGARLGLAVGAFLDFTAGVVPRAPAWVSRAGCEWIYRLLHEPGRLWRRYLVGNPLFLARVTRELLSQPVAVAPAQMEAGSARVRS
jgi:exopolysaccharide biosynthesis WecB/TagA/CpsF family protein